MLFVFEGVDGSGKTTLINSLQKELTQMGFPVVVTREPGGSVIGQSLRRLIMDHEFNNFEITHLFLAARSEHVRSVIWPAILKNQIILCDRFTPSTVVYQGYRECLSDSDTHFLYKQCKRAELPIREYDVFYLDAPTKTLFDRVNSKKTNRLDPTSEKEIDQLKDYYRKYFGDYQDPITIDTSHSLEKATENVGRIIQMKVGRCS